MYNFEKFEAINKKSNNCITITRKSNSMGFPEKFYISNNIKDFKYIVLYYDAESRAIAIKFTSDDNEKNKLSIQKGITYGASVSISGFLKHYKIDTEKYHGKYDWEKSNIENIGSVYIIKLKEYIK
jgi:hypothetical protein